MQDTKWAPSQESAPVYLPLQNNTYPYREAPGVSGPNEGETTMHGIMSMTQPETPRPDNISLPPTPLVDSKSPPERPSLQARPASFTSMTTFPPHPYQLGPPIRKRRADSIFSFEMGPSFSSTKQLYELFSLDQTNGYQVQLHAKMDRGFFRADQDWACYRRNYFQVSATFDVHGINYLLQGPEVPCLLRKSDHELHQVDYFSIGVSACVSNNTDKKIELVQHTPKRDKGPQMVPKPQAVRAGGNLHLASVGSSHHIVTFERMQFKTATANNGKRRAAQQYYEIVISLYANTLHGESIKVATCHSAPLVVRGRSPGHYADSHSRYRHNLTAAAAPPPPPPLGPPHDEPNGSASSSSSVMPPPDRAHLPPPPPPPPHPTQARFMSLPTSPVSDFGPYSPYSNYGYPVAYSPHAAPPPPPPSTHHAAATAPPAPTPSHMSAPGVHYPPHAQQQQDQSSYFARPEDKSVMPPPSAPHTQQPPPQHQLLYDRPSPYYGDSSSYPPTRDGKMLDDKLPSTSAPSSAAPGGFSAAPGYPPYPYEDYGAASYPPPTTSS